MKTELQKRLCSTAPSVCIETIWEHDGDATWDIEDPTLDPADFNPWRSEVRASAIINGELVHGSAYLGGTWEKYGDHPSKSNPEISGYELQMTEEALRDLARQVPSDRREIHDEILWACIIVEKKMKERYDEQMQKA